MCGRTPANRRSWRASARAWASGRGALPSMPSRKARTWAMRSTRRTGNRTTSTRLRSTTQATLSRSVTRYSTSVVSSPRSRWTSCRVTGSTVISEACSRFSLRTRSRNVRYSRSTASAFFCAAARSSVSMASWAVTLTSLSRVRRRISSSTSPRVLPLERTVCVPRRSRKAPEPRVLELPPEILDELDGPPEGSQRLVMAPFPEVAPGDALVAPNQVGYVVEPGGERFRLFEIGQGSCRILPVQRQPSQGDKRVGLSLWDPDFRWDGEGLVEGGLCGREVPETPVSVADEGENPAEIEAAAPPRPVERRTRRQSREILLERLDAFGSLPDGRGIVARRVGRLAETPGEQGGPEELGARTLEIPAQLHARLVGAPGFREVARLVVGERDHKMDVRPPGGDLVAPGLRLQQLEGAETVPDRLLVHAEGSGHPHRGRVCLGGFQRVPPLLRFLRLALVKSERLPPLAAPEHLVGRLMAEPEPAFAAWGGVSDELRDDLCGTQEVRRVPFLHLFHDQLEPRRVPDGPVHHVRPAGEFEGLQGAGGNLHILVRLDL